MRIPKRREIIVSRAGICPVCGLFFVEDKLFDVSDVSYEEVGEWLAQPPVHLCCRNRLPKAMKLGGK